MIAAQTTWSEVGWGSYVQDATGKTWKISSIDHASNTLELTDRDNGKATMGLKPGDTPVTVLGSSDEDALALVASGLGAKMIAEQAAPGEPWKAPTFTGDREAIKLHLEKLHGMFVGSSSQLHELIVAHGASHAKPAQIHVQHFHA